MTQIIKNIGELEIPSGPAQAASDVNSLAREQAQAGMSPGWELHYGVVQYSISQLGWHRVALGGLNGVVVASASGRVDGWGASVPETYQSGTKVLVGVDRISQAAVILGQMPLVETDANALFDLPTFAGSWADIGQDVAADLYMTATAAGGAQAIVNKAPSDQNSADWRVQSTTGIQLFVSPLEAGLVADDITGVWVNLLDQTLQLSGRQIELEADGMKLFSRLDTSYSKFQLAGKLEFYGDVDLSHSPKDIEQLRRTDNEFIYEFSADPVEIFTYNIYAVTTGVIEHNSDTKVVTGDGEIVQFASLTATSYSDLTFVEFGPGPDDEAEQWFPQPDASEDDRQQLSQRLTAWSDQQDFIHYMRPLYAFAHVASGWVLDLDHYVRNRQESDGEDADNLAEAFRLSESIQLHDDLESNQRDPIFQGQVLPGRTKRTAWVSTQNADGSIFIGNEHGAGIRLSGNSVFIEGASIRLAATKDLNVLARDVNLTANRDVNLVSQEFTRVVSNTNVAITGGAYGLGGVLIESRGNNRSVDLPENAQESVYSGVAIRSMNTQIMLYGGDVVAHAGANGAGQLLLRSDGGNLQMVTPFYAVTHSAGVLQTYGPESNPSRSHLFSSSQVIIQGTLAANHGWFAGSVNAGSNIQSFRGRVADSVGGQLARVTETGLFDSGINTFNQTRVEATTDYLERAEELIDRLTDNSGPMSRKTREELSCGFVSSSQAPEHYGAANMQPTYQSLFQASWGLSLKPMQSVNVIYKPNTSAAQFTRPWPGDTENVEIKVPAQVVLLGERIREILSQDPPQQSDEPQPRPFASVFSTL